MNGYEHKTVSVPFEYEVQSIGKMFFKTTREDHSRPLVDQFVTEMNSNPMITALGSEGWELVNVQPVTAAAKHGGNDHIEGAAYSYSLPVAYLLFFKRRCPDI